MTDSQKLAMQAMSLMKANNLPAEVCGQVLDFLMQAGFRYAMEMSRQIAHTEAERNEALINRVMESQQPSYVTLETTDEYGGGFEVQ